VLALWLIRICLLNTVMKWIGNGGLWWKCGGYGSCCGGYVVVEGGDEKLLEVEDEVS
jgi:hypothetical protein